MNEYGRRRFRVYYIDQDARLFRLTCSAWQFHDAWIMVATLRADEGGDWIIIDRDSGRVVGDTRPPLVVDGPSPEAPIADARQERGEAVALGTGARGSDGPEVDGSEVPGGGRAGELGDVPKRRRGRQRDVERID